MNPESFFPITFGVHYNTEHLCDTEKKQKCLEDNNYSSSNVFSRIY